ncbi:MAG: hypothetical protein OHK0046_09420 [Anaerolineae bacterium]
MTEPYIYLDSDVEREQLISEMVQVRRAVIALVQAVPESAHFEPRYDKHSLAALLGYLNLMDNAHMLLVKAALLGIRPAISLRWMQGFAAQMFRKRLVNVSLTSIQKNEQRIGDFIRRLPMSKFSTQVYDPTGESFITVERALQQFFLHQWQAHLQTMREVEQR